MQPGGEVSPNVLVVDTPYFLRRRDTNQLVFQVPVKYCGADPNPPGFPRFNLAPDPQILCAPFNPNEVIFLEALANPNPIGGAFRRSRGSKKAKKSRSRKSRKGKGRR